MIAPPRGYYLSVREGPLKGATIVRNIFYSSNPESQFINELPPKGKGKSEDRRGRVLARAADAETDSNIYWCTADREVGEKFLKTQQADGVDTRSLAVDPLFVDPENGDFRLKPDSPALKLGFVPFDFSKAGLAKDQ